MWSEDTHQGDQTIKKYKEVDPLHVKKMITFGGRQKVYQGACRETSKVLFFDLGSSYNSVCIMTTLNWMQISISMLYFIKKIFQKKKWNIPHVHFSIFIWMEYRHGPKMTLDSHELKMRDISPSPNQPAPECMKESFPVSFHSPSIVTRLSNPILFYQSYSTFSFGLLFFN